MIVFLDRLRRGARVTCLVYIIPDKDVSIYDYLEGEVGHTMFLNPVDDQEIIRTAQN